MKIAVFGIGLIGGSLALSLRETGFASEIWGIEKNPEHGKKALTLGLVDRLGDMDDALREAELIIVATPVNVMIPLVVGLLDRVRPGQVVMDVGSTKNNLIEAVRNHPNRANFIATHPMAGTEFSGPEAAIPRLFEGKCTVLVNAAESGEGALALAQKMYAALGMRIVEMDAAEHDVHTAYVSHISHISSFALALTVLEKEKDEEKIFELASAGFTSTVRLAKSEADTWIPIFQQNRDNVLDVLDEHISVLSRFRSLLIKNNFEEFHRLIHQANDIKRILRN